MRPLVAVWEEFSRPFSIEFVTPHRLIPLAALAAAAVVAFSACGILEPTEVVTPSPTPTVVDKTTYIGETIDPKNTVWTGRDSGGDDTTFTLHDDGTVAVTYSANSYDDPNDTWSVTNGVLHIDVYLDPKNGEAEYVGTWNPETSSLDTVMTTSVSNRTLTVTLTQQ